MDGVSYISTYLIVVDIIKLLMDDANSCSHC